MYNITLDFQHYEDPKEKIFDDDSTYIKPEDEVNENTDDEDDDDTDYVILPSNDEGLT